MNTYHLTFDNTKLLQRKLEFREKLFRTPEAFLPFRKKCLVRTLIVADSFLYFNDENFGLSDLIDFITAAFSTYATVQVSKAHRNNPGAARLNGADANFVFTDEALENIDVLWLFGAHSTEVQSLSEAEISTIARFMNRGGGVFATGDHEDLGYSMCGKIPRVRSMRKWYFPNPGPNGEPAAPIVCGAGRYDTNRLGYDGTWQFNDQSDDIPQQIQPRYYHSGIFKKHPHPLLCGPKGRTIEVLPDHPHEGECIEPWDPEAVLPVDGTFVEYPIGPGGRRELPQVIATSTMIPGTGDPNAQGCPFGKPPITGGFFGAISAYNGHRANVGRVACDATWHHFININLTGDSFAPPPKDVGFLTSASGQQHLADIQAYFRNIALWLAPPDIQRCIALRKLLFEITPGGLFYEELKVASMEKLRDWRDLDHLGGAFRNVFKLNKNICEELVLPELAPPKLLDQLEFLRPLPIPDPPPFRFEQAFAEVTFQAALGAMVRDAFLHMEGARINEMTPDVEKKLIGVLENSFAKGLTIGFEGLEREFKRSREQFAKQLNF